VAGSPFRIRLLTIVLLGAVTSALSLIATFKVLSLTTAQRIERARDVTADALEHLSRGETPERGTATLIGMRGGTLPSLPPPAAWQPEIDAALAAGHVLEQQRGDNMLIVGARRAGDRLVWAGYSIPPPVWLRSWQIVVFFLTFATALLVIVSIVAALRLARSREIEAELQRELAQKERLAALGRVAAGVAHEVRNPLASIKLRLDLAAAGAALPADVEGALSNASSEIARLDRLVSDLLVVAGRKTGPREPRSLGELAESRVQVMQPWAQARGVTISVEGDARAPVDAEALGRAFDNLLRNAIEASPYGGKVTARIIYMAQGKSVHVAVEDGGPGVASERAGELFEPFFTTKPDGTGLGLAMTRAIARAHGGDVTYARDGATTRFELVVAT
jgi:signal transduction histidine kinase